MDLACRDHKEKVARLTQAIIADDNLVELKTNHHYAHETYVRECIIPKDTVVTGKIHRHSCVNIIAKGHLLVVTDEGKYEVKAPDTFISGAGVSKALIALEDSHWFTCHHWEGEQDEDALEKEFVMTDEEYFNLIEDKSGEDQ